MSEGRWSLALDVCWWSLALDVCLAQKISTPVYEDNTACIEWGNNVISRRKQAKHVDISKHFADDEIRNGEVRLIKVSTTSQLADILTKGLHMQQFLACVNGILGVDQD